MTGTMKGMMKEGTGKGQFIYRNVDVVKCSECGNDIAAQMGRLFRGRFMCKYCRPQTRWSKGMKDFWQRTKELLEEEQGHDHLLHITMDEHTDPDQVRKDIDGHRRTCSTYFKTHGSR